MVAEDQAGPSFLRFEPPDIAHFTIIGDVSAADMRRLLAELSNHLAGQEYVLMLADLSRAGSFSAGARKTGAQPKPYAVRGVAIVGASARLQIVAKLVITAANFLARNIESPVFFSATEAEARQWLDSLRNRMHPVPSPAP